MTHQVETLAYAGEKPWRGLGKRVSGELSPREVQREAGLDWEVEKVPLCYEYGNDYRESGHYALIRTSDGQFLDTVKSDYWEPVQNSIAFDFFDYFVRAGNMSMEVAGSLSEGRRVFALTRLRDGFRLERAKEDATESYLLFTNPHLYGQSVDIRFTPIRVVCHNTLTLALGQKNEYRVSFTHWRKFDVDEARRLIRSAADRLGTYRKQANYLAAKRYRPDALDTYFRRVFEPVVPPRTPVNGDLPLTRNARLALKVVETQPGAHYVPGTWWNAFNAVTYLSDHRIGRSPETRLATAWYGHGKSRKVRALNLALEYAKAA